ncbi:hypothetical protein Pcinc_013690 [Petrolisthes cinctipes]|uniref:Uncharacterized protein n=1 Tax=Petrolisthes cinctipes TaxID=88211 RepID=A0AAE1FY60_PETCI|nr:hypothetical protein Pcinc_013690 [Petrolisthes cinctipes]
MNHLPFQPVPCQMLDQISKALARHVTEPLGSELKQQALFTLLGPEFTTQHFPYHTYNPRKLVSGGSVRMLGEMVCGCDGMNGVGIVLRIGRGSVRMLGEMVCGCDGMNGVGIVLRIGRGSVRMLGEMDPVSQRQKEKYLKEAREFLDKCLNKAVKDCGYSEDPSQHEGQDELGEYVREIRASFNEGLKRHTAVVMFEEEAEKSKSREMRRQQQSQASEEDMDEGDQTQSSDYDHYDDDEDDEKATGDTTPADVAGNAVLAFLAHDPGKRESFAQSLRVKQLALSNSLRASFWWEHMVSKEARKLRPKPGENVSKLIRAKFDSTLAKERKSQKLSRAIRSNEWKTIDNAVIEAYDNTTTFRSLDSDAHLIQTARVLNIVNVHSKTFSPTSIFLLLPFQQVLRQRPGEEDEALVMRLAVQMELFRRHYQLDSGDVFTLADQVVEWLQGDDPNYFDHLNTCLNTQISRINIKDFPPEVLLKDRKASVKLHKELVQRGTKDMQSNHETIFTSPTIFVRKWLAQVFVGVVSVSGSMWAWDQLFLDGWSQNTLRRLAFAVLVLIKPWVMRAKMYSGARKMLLEEPGKLYLSDLRHALAHLEEGGDYNTFPPNKNYISPNSVPNRKEREQKESEGGKKAPRDDGKDRTKGDQRAPPSNSQPRSFVSLHLLDFLLPLPPFAVLTPRHTLPSSHSQTECGAWVNVSRVLPFLPDNLFRIDLDLDSDDDDDDNDEPLPIPEPPPDTESEPEPSESGTPSPRLPPTPPPPPSPPPEHQAWLPYNSSSTEPDLPTPTRSTEPFDFYIDAVRFLPDYVSHCKVTARVTNMYASKDQRLPDIVTFPILDSSARCPSFRCKLLLNEERVILNTNMVIVVRVYGYQKHYRRVAVVGTCLVKVFDASHSPPTLCVGGVQRRIRHGLPNPARGLENMVASDMDDNDPIPSLSICYRLLPASKDQVPAPAYETRYYRSEECRPNQTERRLFRHYICQPEYKSTTVADSTREAQREAGERESTDEKDLERYMNETLDWRTIQKKSGQPITHLDYCRFVRYDKNVGINVGVLGLLCLPRQMEGYLCHVYCRLMFYMGREPKPFSTKYPDFLSYQRSPQWLDDPKTQYLDYEEGCVLVLQVYGFEPRYRPGDGKRPGTISGRKVVPLGWTFTHLFDKGSAISGIHWLPLLEGRPDTSLLTSISNTNTPAHVIADNNNSRLRPLELASLEVRVLDGHLDSVDVKEHRIEDMVKATGRADQYARTQLEVFTKTLDDFYLGDMSDAEKQKGIWRTDKERDFFESQTSKTFFRALVSED